MKSIRHLLTLLALTATFWACDKTNTLPTPPEMSGDVSEFVFPKEGGTETFEVKANRNPITATLSNEADAEWCEVSIRPGEGGVNTVTVRISALDGDFRQTVLMLNNSAAVCDVAIKQAGVPALTTLTPTHIDEVSATLGLSWVYSGDIEVEEAGVRLSSGGNTRDCAIEEAKAPGSYTLALSDLTPETEYTVEAYLRTSDGQSFTGEAVSFQTDKAPVNIALSELKEWMTSDSRTVTENWTVEGVVSVLFPLTKAADIATPRFILQDGSVPGSAICVLDPLQAKVGDKVSIRIKDATVEKSRSGALSLKSIVGAVQTLSSGNELSPVTVDHSRLDAYENMYVRIENTQLLNIFTDEANYPSWGSAEKFTLEVEGSTVSFDVFVPAASELSGTAPGKGSGSVGGIVLADGNSPIVMILKKADVSLEASRFESLLDLTFQKPVFYGTMTAGEEIEGCRLEVPFKNGDNSVLSGEITVTVEGPAAEGITVASLTDPTIPAGNGSLVFAVSGLPVQTGEVSFTVNGIPGLADNVCTASVGAPFTPAVGNFNLYWIPTTANVPKSPIPSTLAYEECTNPDVTSTVLTLVASEDNKAGTKWSGDWGAIGWNLNLSGEDVQYYEFTLTVAAGKTLALSGLDFAFRVASGNPDVSFKYSLNGAAFEEFYSCSTSEVTAATIPVGKHAVLKAVPGGSTLVIRVVPSTSASAAKLGLAKDKKFAIYGDVL